MRPARTDQKEKSGDDGQGCGVGLAIAATIILVVLAYSIWVSPTTEAQPLSISYSTFVEQVQDGNVGSVTLAGREVSGSFETEMRRTPAGDLQPYAGEDIEGDHSTEFRTVISEAAEENAISLLEAQGVDIVFEEPGPSYWPTILLFGLPVLLILGFFILMSRRSAGASGQARDVMSFGRSRARRYETGKSTIRFADVAGEDEAKNELMQVVDFLKNPVKYKVIGAKLPKGVLLVGPPGTGKTLLAKAVAGEARVPFFSISASEFVEMFVGVGASRVRDLFSKAKDEAPSIIFVDELDAVGRQRFAGVGGGNDEREQTLNQLLVEMDGFDPHETVIVLAATNRPDVLDPALLRPGRFDRQVELGLPDRRGREEILRIHAAHVRIDDDVDLDAYAAATPGFSGADLANLINEAALLAAEKNRAKVGKEDLDEAVDKVLLGSQRAMIIGERERRILAYHEAGHALVAAMTPGADPLRKITIVPRGRALGVTIQSPTEDRVIYSRLYLVDRLAIMLGGRAAEELIFDDMTTGAENDLKEATSLARRMVGLWGMSPAVGPYFVGLGEQHAFLGREMAQGQHVSEEMLNAAETATRQLLNEALEHATQLLVRERAKLERLAEALLERETVDAEEVRVLLGDIQPVAPVPDRVPEREIADVIASASPDVIPGEGVAGEGG
jgi:cell division protease FtsH